MLSDLLGMSVAEFLVLTQSYTVPLLILSQQVDVIKRISDARKDKQDFLIILENSNLVPTLVLLLQQSTPDMELFIMSNLGRVTPKFKEQHMDLSTLMKQAEPSSQARLLLQAAGEADDSKKSRVCLSRSKSITIYSQRTDSPGTSIFSRTNRGSRCHPNRQQGHRPIS
jgi:serine/threonine-protein kinase ATR